MTCYGKHIAFFYLCSNPSSTSWAFCPVEGNRVNFPVATSNSSRSYPGSRVRWCILILNLFDYLIDSLLLSLQFNSNGFPSCPDWEVKGPLYA